MRLKVGDADLTFPMPEPAWVGELARFLREQQRQAAERPVGEVLQLLDGVNARWADSASPERQAGDTLLAAATGYPPAVIDLLKNECALTRDAVIADVASGTGIFTRMLLENGNRVFGVEPNAAMRKAGEQFLSAYQEQTGRKLTIKQSHGGSSRQARAVIDGLEGDVVTLALSSEVEALRKAAGFP